ncbi:hypothetical protein Gotur_006713 [Gossypium turneri]
MKNKEEFYLIGKVPDYAETQKERDSSLKWIIKRFGSEALLGNLESS